MTTPPDLFKEKAADWDSRPVPVRISSGVFGALERAVALSPTMTVLDFGAGTGLLAGKIAPHVGRLLAVDVSEAMLTQLAQKAELAGKVEIHCQDILQRPLGVQVNLVVSAMAMHHVQDTAALLRAIFAHLVPGGRVALADLDAEEGSFHPADTHGVYHNGFHRAALAGMLIEAGFADPGFVTATEIERDGKCYPIFLVTATKAG